MNLSENLLNLGEKYNDFRLKLFRNTGIFQVIDYLSEKDYGIISNEEDHIKLGKRSILGVGEFLSSYCLLFSAVPFSILTNNPYLAISSGLTGLLLNWDGEIKINNFHRRIEELDLTTADVFDSLRKYSKSKTI